MTDQTKTPAPGADRDGLDVRDALPGRAAHSESTTNPAFEEPAEALRGASSSWEPENPERLATTGESGETGVFPVSNREFLEAVFNQPLPDRARVACCIKSGDPDERGWNAYKWGWGDEVNPGGDLNAYVNCSVFTPGPDGSFRARKDRSAATVFLMLDDIGAKVSPERLEGVTPTWLIETSPGNFQAGLVFAEPVDGAAAARLHNAMRDAGLCDPGANEPRNRWARLPFAINGKPKHARDGEPWRCRLTAWNPESRFTPEQLEDAFELDLEPMPRKRGRKKQRVHAHPDRDTFRPAPEDNPVLRTLESSGFYKRALGEGKHDITCPWVSEHTDGVDSGAAYFEPSEEYPRGGFKCMHSHGDRLSIGDLLEHLGLTSSDADRRPLIRILPGQLSRIVDAAEQVLASDEAYYQAGGLIVSVAADHSGVASIKPTKNGALVYQLSRLVRWEKLDKEGRDWVAADPPGRHVTSLFERQDYKHLRPLTGLAHQPFFDDQGALVTRPGYHAATGRLGVFDANAFRFGDFTREAAEQALALLNGLLDEFAFETEADRAATLSAMLTGAVRPSLRTAPASHIRAPEYGSGKSYLADLIALFAGPSGAMKVSYPSDAAEATKAMLAVLLGGPASVCFDDMTHDWNPHGVVNRALTSETITDRVLGVSQVATVSTRTLFLGTGNNVGPAGDLLRRVVTIRMDHGEARPAEKAYKGNPVRDVRHNRGLYVASALTIIGAWRAAGSPRTDCKALAGFDDWSDACRQPLLWLGLPDPATAVFEAMAADETRDWTAALFEAWFRLFGDRPTTVRKAIKGANETLRDAFDDCGLLDGEKVNARRLGWFLKRAQNRLAGGYRLEACRADGRAAWRVFLVDAKTPVSTVLTVLPSRSEKQRSDDDDDAGLVEAHL